ncbi:MAG TPA: L,D-transpeptidase [Baekduia sp.]|nr:L,D-transpeptidase [Baekduia sp.]
MSHPRAALASAAATALLAAGLGGCGADTEPKSPTQTTPATTPRTTGTVDGRPPQPDDEAKPAALKPPLAFHVRRRAQLRTRPGGKVVTTIKTKTEFKSPTILAVAGRRPGWVRVRTSVRKHDVGWLPLSSGALFTQPRTIVIDLSRRTLSLFHRGKLTDTYKVAIGTQATPTPRGRFAVTDRLTTGHPSGDYGCCILALTGHQDKIAQGWGGGDRVAIHATPHTWTLGKRISHGCVRATNKALRQLMRRVRLGTPVTVHS